jgi:hypothetical protein
MNPKITSLFNRFRKLLKSRVDNFMYGEGAGHGNTLFAKNKIREGNKSKERVLQFFEKNGRWPNRRSESKREVKLGQRFENYISKEAPAYDPQFRRIAMVTGRKTNNKRKHNVQEFKKEIISFIETNGRVPTTYSGEKIAGEGTLRAKLDYYTQTAGDMTLLGEVYSLDKCHRSAIPARFRPLINKALDIEKPLIRLANYELEGK